MDSRCQQARVTFRGKPQFMPLDSPGLRCMVDEASSAAFAMEGAMERMTASTPLVELADGWKVNHAAREQGD